MSEARLTDQGQARREAEQMNAERTQAKQPIAVASPYPFGAWGGTEEGWTVVYLAPPLAWEAP